MILYFDLLIILKFVIFSPFKSRKTINLISRSHFYPRNILTSQVLSCMLMRLVYGRFLDRHKGYLYLLVNFRLRFNIFCQLNYFIQQLFFVIFVYDFSDRKDGQVLNFAKKGYDSSWRIQQSHYALCQLSELLLFWQLVGYC